MSQSQAVLLSHNGRLAREELALVPTPPGTATHRPIPHHQVIDALVETLGLRHIAPVRQEYAVSKDGMKMFGIMELETTFQGCRFAIGIRNAHDKSMRLAMTVGYRLWRAHHKRYYAQQIVMRSSASRCRYSRGEMKKSCT
jgi:hypothetical protein